jgi:hypothetical protein
MTVMMGFWLVLIGVVVYLTVGLAQRRPVVTPRGIAERYPGGSDLGACPPE